jgi:hypothetical protein
MNHPAAAARRSKKPLPPRRESPGHTSKTNANAHITEICRVGGRLPPRPPSLPPRPPREYTSTPLAPRKSAAVDEDLIAVAAQERMAVATGGRKLLPPVWGRYWIHHLLIQVMTKYFLSILLSILRSCMASVCVIAPTSMNTMTRCMICRRTTK